MRGVLVALAAMVVPIVHAQEREVELEAALARIDGWIREVEQQRVAMNGLYDYGEECKKTLDAVFVRRGVGASRGYVDSWSGWVYLDWSPANEMYGRHRDNLQTSRRVVEVQEFATEEQLAKLEKGIGVHRKLHADLVRLFEERLDLLAERALHLDARGRAFEREGIKEEYERLGKLADEAGGRSEERSQAIRAIGRRTEIQPIERLARVDLDVDSDDEDGTREPDRSRAEDAIEDAADARGKLLVATEADADGDEVPDFADFDVRNEALVPIVLELTEPIVPANATVELRYDASDPLAVKRDGERPELPSTGRLRMWRKTGQPRDPRPVAAGGDYVPPGTHPATLLGVNRWGTVTLYLEGVRPGEEALRIEVAAEGGGRPSLRDAVRVRVIEPDEKLPGSFGSRPKPPPALPPREGGPR